MVVASMPQQVARCEVPMCNSVAAVAPHGGKEISAEDCASAGEEEHLLAGLGRPGKLVVAQVALD